MDFNGYRITIEAKFIMVVQKILAEKLVLVDVKDNTKKEQYVEQYTGGKYDISICQLEATFDCSIAAQSKKPRDDNIAFINKLI